MTEKTRFLVAGLTRDSAKYIRAEIEHLNKLFSEFGEVSFHLIESDSSDNTVGVLDSLHKEFPGITFKSMGNLEPQIPLRTERLRLCRNEYVSWVRANSQAFDYVVVVDFDGMNKNLTKSGIQSSLDKKSQWNACFPNQLLGYYDLYALRSPEWIEEDFLPGLRNQIEELGKKEFKFPFRRLRLFLKSDSIRRKTVYKNMRMLAPWGSLIPVESAFGALAIYETKCLIISDYGVIQSEYSECEHVFFHKLLISNGQKLFINPRMINNWVNPYNLNKFFVVRVARNLRSL